MSWVRVPPFRNGGREQMTASPSDKYRANVAEASRAHGEVQKRNALTGKRQAKRGGMCGLRGILKPPTGHSSKARALVRDKGELHLTTLDPGSSPGVPIGWHTFDA